MRSATATTWLVIAAVAFICHLTTSQDLSPAQHRWRWGRRHQTFLPQTQQSVNRPFQSRPQPNSSTHRFARVVESSEPRAQGATTFKSITARTIPSSQPTITKAISNEHEKEGKPPLKPSPIDTTPHIINPTLGSHFDVKEKELNTPDHTQARLNPTTIITPGEYPYPFDAKPVDLGDGTSIGGFIPDDTLPITSHKVSNSHTKGPYKPPQVSDDHDARYTTLDKLFSSRIPTQLPDPQTLSNEVLGGLHPDEVFYADKDLVIIKGGGFHSKDSEKPPGSDDLEQEAENAVKPVPSGNELGEANDPRITNVRPDEKFSRVPLPFRFVNGNIPTIVSPPSNSHQRNQNRQFRPVHDTSFRPLPRYSPRPAQYSSSSSQHSFAYKELPSNFQNLDEQELLSAEPSLVSEVKVLPTPSKRSTDSNVVSYHYQSRGSGSNQRSIVDYTIQRQNSGSSHQQEFSGSQRISTINQNRNFIQTAPEKATPKIHGQVHGNLAANPQGVIGTEDFSVPAGGPVINLVPSVQTPRREPAAGPGRQPAQPHISLEGDTRVNFLPPLPPVNPLSQHFSNNNQGGTSQPSTNQPTRPGTFLPSQPAQLVRQGSQPTRLANTIGENPVSLAGDTRVNYLPPLPPVNRQAEVLAHRPSVRIQPALGTNPQVTRLNPQVTRLAPQRPQTQRRVAPHSNGQKRFMEPRRRTRTKQRPTPTL